MREGLTSGLHVSPQQLAQWVYEKIAREGRTPEKAMEALAWAPSSQVNKDRMVAGSDRMVPKVETLPGGPAGGLLPYVWVRFIKQAYELLNIDPNEVQKSSGGNWTWEADSVMIDGKRVKNPMNIEGLPDPKIMFEQAKPILQRVLDAGRLEIERSTEDNLAQRDFQKSEAFEKEEAEGDAPEGSMDNQETETKLGSGKVVQDAMDSDPSTQDETEGVKIKDKQRPSLGVVVGVKEDATTIESAKGKKYRADTFPLVAVRPLEEDKIKPLVKIGDRLLSIKEVGGEERSVTLDGKDFPEANGKLKNFLTSMQTPVDLEVIVIPKGEKGKAKRKITVDQTIGESFQPKSRGSSQSTVEEDAKFLEIFKKFKLEGLKERYPDISPRKLSMRAQYLLDIEANREKHPHIWRNDELVENTDGTLPEILYFPEAPLGMVDKDKLLLPEYFPRTSALRYGGRQNPPVMDVLKALRKDLMDLVKDGRKRGFNYGHLTDDPTFPKSDKDLLKVVNAMIQIVGRSKAHKFDGWRLFAEGESVKEEYKNRLKEDEKTGAFVINDAGTDAVPLGGVHYRNNLGFQTIGSWGIFLHELWHTVTIPMTSVLKAKDAIHDAVYPEEGTPEDAIRLRLEEFRIADEAEGKSPEEIEENQTVVRNAIASYKQFVPKEKAAHIAQAAYNLNALRVVALDEALRRIKAGTMEDHVFDQLRYGLMTDQAEFFMETMTRKETQEFLSEIRPTDEQLYHLGYDPNAERRPSTLLEVFYDAILGLFGIDRKTLDGTVLQKVLWNAEPLMDTNFKEPTQSAEAWRESVRESRSLGSSLSPTNKKHISDVVLPEWFRSQLGYREDEKRKLPKIMQSPIRPEDGRPVSVFIDTTRKHDKRSHNPDSIKGYHTGVIAVDKQFQKSFDAPTSRGDASSQFSEKRGEVIRLRTQPSREMALAVGALNTLNMFRDYPGDVSIVLDSRSLVEKLKGVESEKYRSNDTKIQEIYDYIFNEAESIVSGIQASGGSVLFTLAYRKSGVKGKASGASFGIELAHSIASIHGGSFRPRNRRKTIPSVDEWADKTYSLGSSYSLSSHAPEIDLNEHVSLISRIGSSDRVKGWKDLWERLKDKLPGAKDGLISSLVNQADASSRVIEKFMRDAGVKDQALLDSLDIRGLWHQYYGKTDESVRQAQLQFIEPIEDALREHGISLEKFGSYLLARAAPSRNIRLKKMYQDELAKATKESDKKMLTKLLKEHGDNLSGIHTDMAVELVKDFEKEAEFSAFIEDSRNPLQLFYDMNREALKFKAESGMIRSKQDAKGEFQPDIDEYEAMMQAASHFDWSKEGSKFTYMNGGKKSNYSYAPMQGFEGEAEGKLWDAESAFQVMGKSQTSSGKGWDQPKHKFLSKGSFGRYLKNSKTSIRDGDGNKEVVGPDPLVTFKTAQEQYFDSSIRSHKNEVSTAYGTAFEIMRAVAYPDDALSETADGPPPFNLEKEAPEIFQRMKEDPSITEKAREMFEGENAVFEKEFRPLQETKDYKIDEKKIQVDGKDVAGLSMVRKQIDTTFQNNPHVFVYRKSGVAHMIKFKQNERGSRVARSLKNLRYEPLPSVLQAPNKIVRFMASMFTSKNPLFWVPNMVRDLGTMGIHLTEDDKANMVKDAFNPKTLAGLMKGVWKVERDMQKGKATLLENAPMTEEYAKELLASGDYARMYQFAKQAGGKVGYFRHKPLTELIDEFRESTEQAKKKKGAVKKSWKSLWDFVDAGSSAFENAVRMSAFWSAIKTGRTVHQAANISRNISVDFNQKGELSQILGSQFVFFSASVNSADRMIQTFKKRGLKGSAKFVAKFAGAAFILATLNRLLDDEDEEKATSDFDTQSSYRRDSNAIIVLPDDKGSISIPMPLGYNAIWAMGNTLADAFWDSMSDEDIITPAEFITRNGMAAMNAFNPIGGANISTVLTPSWAKPVQEILTNEDFLGREITKEDLAFEVAKPTHLRTNDRTQQHWVDLDRKMNEWMGGNDTITGSMSGLFGGDAAKSRDGKKTLSGSDIEHFILGYTGGPGQIFNAIFGQGVWPSASEDYEEFNPNKTPFINKFYRANSHESYVRQRYYHTRIMVKTAEAEIKKAGNNKALANQIRADRKDLLQLSASIKYADGLRSKIRAQKNKIKNGNLTFEQKMQRIAKLEDKEHDALRTVVKKGQKLGLI